MPRLFFGAAALIAAAGPALGVVRTITFDTDASGAPITNQTPLGSQFAIWGITFAPNCFLPGALSGSGSSKNLWAGNTDMTITSSDLGGAPAGSGNVLHAFGFGSAPGWLAENGDASFRISFATPVDSITLDFYSVNGSVGFTGLIAYHDSTPLADLRVTGAGNQTLSLTGVGPITSVAVMEGTYDDWVGVDNIVVNTIEAPAPSSVALLGAGGVALARRRRRPTVRSRAETQPARRPVFAGHYHCSAMNPLIRAFVPAAACACLPMAAAGTVVLSTGFEPPDYLPGILTGQQGWLTTASQASAGAARIVGTVVRTGAQAVAIESILIPSADWFFKPLNFTPPGSEPVVRVSVDMYLARSALESQGWGVDVYDLSDVRIGQFSVSPNGLVSISDGVATTPAALAAHDLWNHFEFSLDFAQRRFWLGVNGAGPVGSMAFNPAAGSGVSDADFRVFGAGTDVAYFDNFLIETIPAPATATTAVGLLGLFGNRRRRP